MIVFSEFLFITEYWRVATDGHPSGVGLVLLTLPRGETRATGRPALKAGRNHPLKWTKSWLPMTSGMEDLPSRMEECYCHYHGHDRGFWKPRPQSWSTAAPFHPRRTNFPKNIGRDTHIYIKYLFYILIIC